MYKFEFKYWFIKSTILKVFASGCVDPCVCYILITGLTLSAYTQIGC